MPSNAARLETGPTSSKSVQCIICSKRFSRTDHLKRHQLRHSGVKPYSCIFCGDGFTRSDNLRDHYPSCSQRRNRQIPEAARGGRRSHACDSCTSMKLGCDGKNPCKTCQQKNIECRFSRLESKGMVIRNETPKTAGTQDGNSDRGSINFLLNSGTASFIDCFNLPSAHERRHLFNFRNTQQATSPVEPFSGSSENGSVGNFSSLDNESIDWSLFEDENLLRFLSSPFTFSNEQAPPLPNLAFPGEWEPPSAQSSAIVQSILGRAMYLQVSPQEQANIAQHLNFLYTPSRIVKFVSTAFEFWHPHCPILHTPSFNIDTVPLPLLSTVALMGALYSKDDRDVTAAKFIMDLVEFYVFSIDDMTEEFEIRQIMRSERADSVQPTPLALQHLQAGYIITCVQFWAGSMASRKRAIDTRFSAVLKVARRLNLPKARHDPSETMSEALWIQKECQIRLINIMVLFDSALLFFANFPTRFTFPEMRFDLACEERFFSSPHPFAERGFAPSRMMTTLEAFQGLFARGGGKSNPMGLNPTDMFTLIHLLYVYAHTQITMFSPLSPSPSPSFLPLSTSPPLTHSPHPSTSSSAASAASAGITAPSPSGSSTPSPLETSQNITIIKSALSRWHTLWLSIRSNIPHAEWARLGFFRNAYNYWLITQLIVGNSRSCEVLCGMEVGCEDTLDVLRGLLKVDSGNGGGEGISGMGSGEGRGEGGERVVL